MTAKKKLGIIGGMGTRAGLILFQKILEYSPACSDQEFLEIILHSNSGIPDRTRAILLNEADPVEALLKSIRLFNENEVEAIVMACITSYFFYDRIAEHTKAKIINPFQLVGEYISEHYPAVRKIGLLATTGTIKTRMFNKALSQHNIEVLTLNDDDHQNFFMEPIYMKNGFKSSVISDKAKSLLENAVVLLQSGGAELIIGGCSEVPIALSQRNMLIPFVDTIDILAKETVNYCYNFKK